MRTLFPRLLYLILCFAALWAFTSCAGGWASDISYTHPDGRAVEFHLERGGK